MLMSFSVEGAYAVDSNRAWPPKLLKPLYEDGACPPSVLEAIRPEATRKANPWVVVATVTIFHWVPKYLPHPSHRWVYYQRWIVYPPLALERSLDALDKKFFCLRNKSTVLLFRLYEALRVASSLSLHLTPSWGFKAPQAGVKCTQPVYRLIGKLYTPSYPIQQPIKLGGDYDLFSYPSGLRIEDPRSRTPDQT
ncbi:hypothetical protein L0F63_001095 [Massospora cicadina]|nr:hypothetical protein L0F63_001095 [Massospora cicadina]